MIFRNFLNAVIFFNLQLIGSLDTKRQIYPTWEKIFQDIKNNSLKHYLKHPIDICLEEVMRNFTYLQVTWVSIKSICFTICSETWHFTLGNPFTYLGINITRLFCYFCGKCSFRLILPILMYWRAFPVIFQYDFMFVKPHDVPPRLCFNVQTEIRFWVEQLRFTTPTLWKLKYV